MTTGYTSIPTRTDHSDHEDDEEDNDRTPLAPTSQRAERRRSLPSATAVHVDQLFQNWTKTIAKKLQVKKRKPAVVDKNEKVDIMVSVFHVWEGNTASEGKGRVTEFNTLDHEPPMTRETFDG